MPTQLYKRSLVLLIGLFILALGVTLSIHSHLGTSPISSVPYAFSHFMPLSIGLLTIAMHFIFIVLQMLLLKRDFQWRLWLQLPLGLIFGLLIDFTLWLSSTWNIESNFDNSSYIVQICLSLMSCLLTALGVCLMIKANLMILAGEGLYQAFSQRFGFNVGHCKTIGDCLLVLFAAISAYLAIQQVVGIGAGTILTALLVGSLVRWMMPYLDYFDFSAKQTITHQCESR